MRNGLRKLTRSLNVGVDKVMLDAIVFVMILTLITFIAGITLTGKSALDMIKY
jgi:short subunit fatty acids transporter